MSKALLIFDVDGTLVDSSKQDDSAFAKIFLDEFGKRIDKLDWSQFPDVTDTGLLEDIYLEHFGYQISTDRIQSFKTNFIDRISQQSDEFHEVPGAKNFYHTMSDFGFDTAVATGGWLETAKIKLNAAEIFPVPLTMASSNDSRSRRSIINIAIARAQYTYNRKHEHIIYFGDGVWDARTCQAMDIPLIGIDIGNTNRLENEKVEVVFNDFLDVDLVLNSIEEVLKSSKS